MIKYIYKIKYEEKSVNYKRKKIKLSMHASRCMNLIGSDLYVTLHRILMLKVKVRARHAFTLKQKNLF